MATALLAVVLTLVVQVVQYASRAARHGQETAEVFSSARAVLDTVGRDLENAVIREDLAAFPSSNSADGLGSMSFYARVPGVATNSTAATNVRRVSLIRYDHDTDNVALIRSDMSVSWSDSNSVISFGNTTSFPMLSMVKSRKLCDGIVGFDAVYIQEDGGVSRSPAAGGARIRAVRVTVALVDPEASKLLSRANLTGRFTALFADKRPTDPTANTKSAWAAALNDGSVWNGVPEAARRRMKIYERFITLPQS